MYANELQLRRGFHARLMSAAGSQDENRNIVLKIFGAVALIWLAFGFSLTALVSLAIAGVVAAVLSRFTRSRYGILRACRQQGTLKAASLHI